MNLINKIKKESKNFATIGGILLATNLSSFATVGMQKNISNLKNETAAINNSLQSIPVIYDIGFSIGHKTFYQDNNYMKTAESKIGHKNLYSRKYLDKLSTTIDKFSN